jgi:hypothetical protein
MGYGREAMGEWMDLEIMQSGNNVMLVTTSLLPFHDLTQGKRDAVYEAVINHEGQMWLL